MAAVDISEAKKRALIDEFGKLSDKLEPLKPDIKRHKELRDEIAGWYEAADAEKQFTLDGKLYTVEVTPKAEERVVVSMAKLAKRMGSKLFMSLAKLPARALDQHLSPEEQKGFVVRKRTGARRVSVEKKKEAA